MLKTLGISFLAAAVGGAALLSLGDLRRSVRDLQGRFLRTETRLRETRGEFDLLRDETGTALTRALARLSPAPEPRLDVAALHHDILSPSVQVNAKGSVGGGTLLFSRENHSYVVTACHVVQKILVRDDDEETRAPVEVVIYDVRGRVSDAVDGDLVAWDERKDLALLRLRSVHEFTNVAKLATRETMSTVGIFTPIYAVGCPLGHDPLPTIGEIATLNKEVNHEKFWMMNAPTIFGNSGGGVFHRETRELVGVSVMVCTYDGAVSTPVPHLGILVPLDSVYDWLDSLDYQFVYDPEYPLEAAGFAHAAKKSAPPGSGAEKPHSSAATSNR